MSESRHGLYWLIFAVCLLLGAADLMVVNLVAGPAWIASRSSLSQPATPPQPDRSTPSIGHSSHILPSAPEQPAPGTSVVPVAPLASAPIAQSTASAQRPPEVLGASTLLGPPASALAPPSVAAVSAPSSSPVPTEGRSGRAFATIRFDPNSTLVTAEARASLLSASRQFARDLRLRVRLEGHADERGRKDVNDWLGVRRAEAAKQYLISVGVDPGRIETVGFGADRPLDSSGSEDGRASNRRVEIIFK